VVACQHCAPPEPDRANSRFRRILWLALAINGSMFLVEVIVSWVSGSLALQADALDFLGDSFNYAISLLVVGMGLRARASAALFKGATMAAFGAWILGTASYRVFTGAVPEPALMGATAALALLANVAVAALLFRYRDGDSNRRSIWLCSRNDAVGNIAVMLAAAGVVTTASQWPDLLVAGIIASLNLSAALQVSRQAFVELESTEPHRPGGAHGGD